MQKKDAAADEPEEQVERRKLAVSASAVFPASEIFGVKLVNGQSTQAIVTFSNEEESPVSVNFIGGSLWSLDDGDSRIVRNLTAKRYSVEIPAGQKQALNYDFATEMHPQDLVLALASVVSNEEGRFFTVQAYNGTVSVVEPDTSIFDPQM